MGSNEYDDEKPVHPVNVGAFCMDVMEVTTDAYSACVRAGRCTPADTSSNCNAGQAGRGNHPINCVNWNQATAHCTSLGKRLPTEEEWEYGARGSEGRKYPWGDTEPGAQLCWDGNGNDLGKGNRKSTCTVGSYPAGKSPFGLMDMAGNVWEWTASGYSDDCSKTRASAARVNRGGSWNNDNPANVRGANRNRNTPTNRNNNLGFRCARRRRSPTERSRSPRPCSAAPRPGPWPQARRADEPPPRLPVRRPRRRRCPWSVGLMGVGSGARGIGHGRK